MLGVRRLSPPFSLDDLELERSAVASKISKNQPLSIYESTLEKLRQGSRRAFKMIEGPKEEPQKSLASPTSMEVEKEPTLEKLSQGSRQSFKMMEGSKQEPQKSMEVDQGTNVVKILRQELIDSTQTK